MEIFHFDSNLKRIKRRDLMFQAKNKTWNAKSILKKKKKKKKLINKQIVIKKKQKSK